MGVHQNTVNNLINSGAVTVSVAIKLAAPLVHLPDFCLIFSWLYECVATPDEVLAVNRNI